VSETQFPRHIMKIVYLNTLATQGGAERSLVDIWAALRPLGGPGLDLHVVCGEDGPLRIEAERHGVAYHVLRLPSGLARLGDAGAGLSGSRSQALLVLGRLLQRGASALAYAAQMRSLLRKLRPTLVHSNAMRYHLLTPLVRPSGVPCIWHIRDFITPRPLLSRLLRLASPGLTLAVANSEATAADARSALPRSRVVTVYNGIDLDTFTPGPGCPDRLDELAGLSPAPQNTLRIGLVATYARWKGQDLLLRVLARIAREHPDLRLRCYIVGGAIYQTDGSQFSEKELRQLAESLGRPPVGFVPFQDRPVEVYRSLDVVVHASTRAEPFGRTIVEAMACGRAVVASLAGGVGELIRPGVDALGFTPNDETELTAALVGLARNPELRQALASAAPSGASRFSRALTAERLWRIYRDLAAGRDQGAAPGQSRT
jgi:glycosyltransferase involved in cell wall biosynthesis